MGAKEIQNGHYCYVVHKQVANGVGYHLYLCTRKETKDLPERSCLLQIALDATCNSALERAAYILQELKRCADEVEEEYAKVKERPDDALNYDRQFPELVDSFIFHEQGGRRVNILAFRDVEKVTEMVPLISITAKDGLRVDLRTSVWIMGKILKLFVLTHSERISLQLVFGNNILIHPDYHYVLMLDFSMAQIHLDTIPSEIRRQEISQAARVVITVLGGDWEKGTFPDDGEEGFAQLTGHLLRLARGGENSAKRAHQEFYELTDLFWKREYHPFTVYPL